MDHRGVLEPPCWDTASISDAAYAVLAEVLRRCLGDSGRSANLRSSRVVDLPDPVPGDGQQSDDVSTVGLNCADTHHSLS